MSTPSSSFASLSLAELRRAHAAGRRPYHEFVREASMSVGLYVLAAGATDDQQPHTEDEVYVVLHGRGRFSGGSASREVATGDTIFVPARMEHRFHDITEDLVLIVVFAPAEHSRAG